MLKSWTTCVRCWSRRNFPAVTRWSSVGRKNSICPFPACPKRASISSLPVLCSTLIFIRLWSDTLVWLCGSLSGIKTLRMKPAPCLAPLPCSPWDWKGEQWAPLVAEYLDLCDDEHSSLQEKFLHALIRKFGFQTWTLGVLVRGALSMQWLKPAKEFRSLIANAESLDALLTVKRRFSAYLLPEEDKDPKFRAIAWQSLLWAIWGSASENGGSKVIKTAPKELKEKYQQVFA